MQVVIDEPRIVVSPNPNMGQFRLDFFKNNNIITNVKIYNNLGVLIYENLEVKQTNLVDLSDFGSGLYWVLVDMEGVVYRESVFVGI